MAIDNVLAFELVTADGMLRRAAADEHPELFWALRGGGGNFGVVTAIEYRAHPIGAVLGGMLVFPLAEAAAVLRAYRDLPVPDELGSLAILATFPGVGPALMLQLCYAGADLEAGNELLRPLRAAGQVALDTVQGMPYADFFMAYTPPVPDGRFYYDTACALAEPLCDAAIAELIDSAAHATSPLASIVLHTLHGAATRVAPTATAFALRRPHRMAVHAAAWEEGDGAAHIAWAEAGTQALQPFAEAGLYVNFMGIGTETEVRAAYAANYERLRVLKAEYDPQNCFRLNQNIRPAAQRRGL
jgi:FAD/FMN-containing dehydrogenase